MDRFQRDAEIRARFLAGEAPPALAKRFGVTPQRIRQILKRQRLHYADSPRSKGVVEHAATILKARSLQWQKRFGITLAQRQAILAKHGTQPFALYRQWKRNREHTGFVGGMTFSAWWNLVRPRWARFQRDKLAIVRARLDEPFSASNCKVARLGAHVVAVRRHYAR